MDSPTPPSRPPFHHEAERLKTHLTRHNPYGAYLVSGLSTGGGAAIAIEWNKFIEQGRPVPIWETMLVAVVSTAAALFLTDLVLGIIQRWRSDRQ